MTRTANSGLYDAVIKGAVIQVAVIQGAVIQGAASVLRSCRSGTDIAVK